MNYQQLDKLLKTHNIELFDHELRLFEKRLNNFQELIFIINNYAIHKCHQKICDVKHIFISNKHFTKLIKTLNNNNINLTNWIYSINKKKITLLIYYLLSYKWKKAFYLVCK